MSSTAAHHPLPLPPDQQQDQRPFQQRPRTKSTFSFHSHKSNGSGGQKIDLFETHEEKAAKRLQTKADPSMAITEAEPSVVANEKSQLGSIRNIQHRDSHGNPIADPDRSNPTRSRWERPLDTIRAFEAAIDGNYLRKSYMRNDSPQNRRSSYYGGTQAADDRPRYQHSMSYGGGRSQSYRPESTYMDNRSMARPESYYNTGDNQGPSNGYHPNRARYPRTATEPSFNKYNGSVYPINGMQQSYETVATGSGSGSSGEPVGYTTDPSSENSSFDRVLPLPPKEPTETYGFEGFGNNPQYLPPGSGLEDRYGSQGAQQQGYGYENQGSPVARNQSGIPPRVPIKLGMTSGNAQPPPVQRPAAAEKRKSWFGKRFSRS